MNKREARKHIAEINKRLKEQQEETLSKMPFGPRYQVFCDGKWKGKCWIHDTHTGKRVRKSTKPSTGENIQLAEDEAKKLNAEASGMYRVRRRSE